MVKCSECGFLAARNIYTRGLDEVEEEFRQNGVPPVGVLGGKEIGYPIQRQQPLCFIREYDLLDSFRKGTKNGGATQSFLAVINEDRRCDPFTKWQQGFTPKEHREMIDRQEWRNWQEKQHKENIKWRITELIFLVIGAGLFTLLGAYFARGGS